MPYDNMQRFLHIFQTKIHPLKLKILSIFSTKTKDIPFLGKYGFTFPKFNHNNKLKLITFQTPLKPEISRFNDGVEVLFQESLTSRNQNAIWATRCQKKPLPSYM